MITDPLEEKVEKGGSQFADVSNYLSANQQQGKRLASQVGQNVVSAGNQARESLDKTKTGFNTAVNASTVPYNEAIVQRAQTDPRSFYNYATPQGSQENSQNQGRGNGNRSGSGNGDVKGHGKISNYLSQQSSQQPMQNQPIAPIFAPERTAGTSADVAEFQKMRDATYTGPMDLTGQEGYGQAQTDEQKASLMAGQTDDAIGQQDLLSGLYQGSAGRSSPLDQLLLGTGQAQGVLQGAAGQNADISGMTDRANVDSIAASDAARATTDKTREAVQNAMYGEGGAFQGLQSDWQASQQKGGGKGWKENQALKQDELKQKLDALNRLMGTDYKA